MILLLLPRTVHELTVGPVTAGVLEVMAEGIQRRPPHVLRLLGVWMAVLTARTAVADIAQVVAADVVAGPWASARAIIAQRTTVIAYIASVRTTTHVYAANYRHSIAVVYILHLFGTA